jgi:hypothetical protein
MELKSLTCKKPLYADIIRDGGSYCFRYKDNNGKTYELFIKVVLGSPADCTRYYEPLVYLGDCNSKNVACHPTWEQAKEFMAGVKFADERFEEMKWIVDNGGWDVPKTLNK